VTVRAADKRANNTKKQSKWFYKGCIEEY